MVRAPSSLALRAARGKPGAEVITTPFTAIPTIGAIIEAGAVPVLVDIDPDTYPDRPRLSRGRSHAQDPGRRTGPYIRKRRRHSGAAGANRIDGIFIIEDAAQAHGAAWRKLRGHDRATSAPSASIRRRISAATATAARSCARRGTAHQLRMLRNHGMRDKDMCDTPGTNSRLDELQAAILRVKLAASRRDECGPRQLVARVSRTFFRPIGFGRRKSRVAWRRTGTYSRCASTAIATDWSSIWRRAISRRNVYYVVPHHLQPALAHLGYRTGSLPHTERVCAEAIALPLYPEMNESVVDSG